MAANLTVTAEASGDAVYPPVTTSDLKTGREAIQPDRGSLRQLYLVYDQRDASMISAWADVLFEEGCEVLHPAFEGGDEAALREYHEDNLRCCDGLLIFYGTGNEPWVRRRLGEVQKCAVYRPNRTPPAVGVCLVTPRTAGKERFRTHQALVIPQWDGVSLKSLRPFLAAMRTIWQTSTRLVDSTSAVVSFSPGKPSVLLSRAPADQRFTGDVFVSSTRFDTTASTQAHRGRLAADTPVAGVNPAAMFELVNRRGIVLKAQQKLMALSKAADAFMSRPWPFDRLWHGSEDSVAELYLVPVAMGVLSLTMWLSMPTLAEVVASRADRIKARHDMITRFAAQPSRPSWSVDGCAAKFDPPIRIRDSPLRDDRRNTEVFGASDFSWGIDNTLVQDLNLSLAGGLELVLYWYKHTPNPDPDRGRWGKRRIAAVVERPLSYRYLVLYGTRFAEPLGRQPDGSFGGSVDVGAYVFDFETGSPICQVAFRETIRDDPPGYPEGVPRLLIANVQERLASTLTGDPAPATR